MGYEPGDVVSGFDLPNANGSGNLSLDKVLTDVGAIAVSYTHLTLPTTPYV